MTEHRLYPEGETPYVSTAAFHADRDRAPHLEQPAHRPRLHAAAALVHQAARGLDEPATVVDLGCGDGGLLALLRPLACWGYDFQPSNAAGWAERGVAAHSADAFGADRDTVDLARIVVMTEVLEHLADPHEAVRWIGGELAAGSYLVASSPWCEHPGAHDECHAWAWDFAGYADLVRQGGFRVVRHEPVGPFQLLLAVRQ
jgi:SAM-dependent methyltransferase